MNEIFMQHVSFKDEQYEVYLPWKESHPPLQLVHAKGGLFRKIGQDPKL